MAEVKPVDRKAPSACCGGPAPKQSDACCVKDADAKEAGESGCGCGTARPSAKETTPTSGCCG